MQPTSATNPQVSNAQHPQDQQFEPSQGLARIAEPRCRSPLAFLIAGCTEPPRLFCRLWCPGLGVPRAWCPGLSGRGSLNRILGFPRRKTLVSSLLRRRRELRCHDPRTSRRRLRWVHRGRARVRSVLGPSAVPFKILSDRHELPQCHQRRDHELLRPGNRDIRAGEDDIKGRRDMAKGSDVLWRRWRMRA